MPSIWEYLAFYLGFKKKQNDIRKERLGLSDETEFSLPSEMMRTLDYQFPEDGAFWLHVEPMNDTPVRVLLVDYRNLARLEAGNRFDAAIDATITSPETFQVRLSGGKYSLMIENVHRSLEAVGYLELEFEPE